MREMKDSGIEWIGEIPKDWSIIKIKYTTELRNEKGLFNPETDSYIGLDNVRGYRNELFVSESEYEESIQSICCRNDVMFGKLRPYLAKVIISPVDGFCTGEFLQIKEYRGDRRFLRYFLLAPGFIDMVNASTYGTKMPRANSEFILNSFMLYPSFQEQKRIADFLDLKCSEIDSLTADIEEQIETLEQYKKSIITEAVTKGLDLDAEMKDSGIDWIGKIPEDWEVTKIDSLYNLRNEKVSDKDYPPLSVTMKGIVPQLETAAKTNDGDNRKLVRKGDFAINSRSDRRGSCGISEYDGSVSQINTVLCPKSNMHPGYYNWLFHSPLFSDEFYRWGHGIVDDLWTTNWQDMKKIMLPVPPLSEQASISDYLNDKCAEIDSVIVDKQKQLDTLAEYKKSIIYEYVTGKKEVPSA